MLIAASATVLVLASSGLASGRSAEEEQQPDVRAFRSFDFDPVFDPVFSLALVAENLAGCDTPVTDDRFEDGRGLSISLGGEVLFRSGEPNIQIDYGADYEPVSSYVSHFGVGSFIAYVPGSLAEGPSEVVIECRDQLGEWVTSFAGTVVVPGVDVPLWLVGIGGVSSDERLFANHMAFDDAPTVAVELDGVPVDLVPDPDFPDSLSAPLPDDLQPGLHIVTVRANGLTGEQATVAFDGLVEAVEAELAEPPSAEPVEAETEATVEAPGTGGDDPLDDQAAPEPETVDDELGDEVAQQEVDDEGDQGTTAEAAEDEPGSEGLVGPYAWVVAPPEFDWSTSRLLTSIGLALLLVVLVGWQADVVNKTIEANRDDIRTWPFVRWLTSSVGGVRESALAARLRGIRYRQVLMLGVYATMLASLAALAAPGNNKSRWFDALLWDAPGTALAILLVVGVYAWAVEAFERVFEPNGRAEFRLIPWSVVPAVALTLVSWAGEFRPPYIYGLIGGFLADRTLSQRRDEHEDAGRAHAYGAGILLTLALCFFALAGSSHPLEDGASWFETLRNRFVVGTFVVAIQALVFGMLPLEFMDGSKVFRWRKSAWALLYFFGLAGFVHVLILQRSQVAASADVDSARAITSSIALFAGFMVGSFLFWSYFRLRSSGHPNDGNAPSEPAPIEVTDGEESQDSAEADQSDDGAGTDDLDLRDRLDADEAVSTPDGTAQIPVEESPEP